MSRAIALVVLCFAVASVARADDAAACRTGDTAACVRIGELKRLGALKADGTKDVDKLVEACGKALDASPFEEVASACGQLFNAQLWTSLRALTHMPKDMLEPVLATAWAEAYCPVLAKPVDGCRGTKAANFSSMRPPAVRKALKALDAAALEKELGAATAKALAPKFDAAFVRLLGPGT